MSAKNLWGDLKALEKVRSPKAILLDQAYYLTKATESVLIGEVNGDAAGEDAFRYTLDVRVPALNNYRYTILSISHPLALFPVVVRVPKQVPRHCANEEAFEKAIASILSSTQVKTALSRLLSQVM